MVKELDKIKIAAFKGKNSSFLAPLLCQLDVDWDESIPTACVGGKKIRFNPDFMMNLPAEQRGYVLIHELWHVARLHQYRRKDRDLKLWNMACDYRINNDMDVDGYKISKIPDILLDYTYSCPEPWAEEDIYKELEKNADGSTQFMQDIEPEAGEGEGKEFKEVVAAINKAAIQAKMVDKSFSLEDVGLSKLLSDVIKPPVRWDVVLQNWVTDVIKEDWTWRRPNRRFEDYRPSIDEEEVITSINIWLDTSGSMTQEDLKIALGTLKALMSQYQRLKVTFWCFDTKITSKKEFHTVIPKEIEITGFGGTVFDEPAIEINKRKDDIHIVITDLYFNPVPLRNNFKLIWLIPVDYNKDMSYPHKKIVYGN